MAMGSGSRRIRATSKGSRKFVREDGTLSNLSTTQLWKLARRYKEDSKSVLPDVIPPNHHVINQILCEKNDNRKKEYCVLWECGRKTWEPPKDLPKEELAYYKKKGTVSLVDYIDLVDYCGLGKDTTDEDSDDTVPTELEQETE